MVKRGEVGESSLFDLIWASEKISRSWILEGEGRGRQGGIERLGGSTKKNTINLSICMTSLKSRGLSTFSMITEFAKSTTGMGEIGKK